MNIHEQLGIINKYEYVKLEKVNSDKGENVYIYNLFSIGDSIILEGYDGVDSKCFTSPVIIDRVLEASNLRTYYDSADKNLIMTYLLLS